jgi:hypothetical protein
MMEKKKYQKPSMEEYNIREKINLLAGSPEGGPNHIPDHNINDDMNHLAE